MNIALIQNGEPILGVVYAPALKRIWWGARSFEAQVALIEGDSVKSPHEIRIRPVPEKGLTVVGSRSHGSGEGDARLEGLNISDYAVLGSSLKFCLVAEGRADLYPRFGRTMEWDTAAGDAILRTAGGQVVDSARRPLIYGKVCQVHDGDYANGAFWAYGDEILLDHVVGLKGATQ